MSRARVLAVFVALAVAISAAFLLIPRVSSMIGEAQPLALRTQPGFPTPVLGCPAVGFVPVMVERSDGSLVFSRVDNQQHVPLAWPPGYFARVLDGRAELVAFAGSVVAREGDVITNLTGGSADDGTFLVCISILFSLEIVPAR